MRGLFQDARLVGAEMRVVGAPVSHPARGAESRALLTARIRPVYYDASGAVYPEVDVDVFLDPGGTLNAESGNDNPRVSNLSLSVSVDGRETTAVVYAVPSRHSASIAVELVATTALGASYLARTIVLDDSGAAPRAVVDGRPLRLGGTLAFRALDIHSREAKVVSVVYRRPFRGLEIYETLRPQGEGLLESVCGAGEDRWRVPGFAETHALLLSRDDSPTLRVFGSQAGLPSGALGEFSFGDAPALIPSDDVSPLSGGGYWSGAFTSETNAQSGLRIASRVGFDSDSNFNSDSNLARIVCAREVGDSSTAFSFYGESFEGESDLPQVARDWIATGAARGANRARLVSLALHWFSVEGADFETYLANGDERDNTIRDVNYASGAFDSDAGLAGGGGLFAGQSSAGCFGLFCSLGVGVGAKGGGCGGGSGGDCSAVDGGDAGLERNTHASAAGGAYYLGAAPGRNASEFFRLECGADSSGDFGSAFADAERLRGGVGARGR